MATVFDINKGINKPLTFKGFKAQYIIYMVLGLVFLLLLFAILYLSGINTYVCMGLVVPPAIVLFTIIRRISDKYGVNGLMKAGAHKKLPKSVKVKSAKFFNALKA